MFIYTLAAECKLEVKTCDFITVGSVFDSVSYIHKQSV